MSTYRTDPELEQLLDEPGYWVVKDIKDSVVVRCESLRDAVKAAAGMRSASVSRLAPDKIDVFSSQVERLAKRCQ